MIPLRGGAQAFNSPAYDDLIEGRCVRAVHQARRRSHQEQARRTRVMRAIFGAGNGSMSPSASCAGSLRATAAFLQHCATIYARLSLNHRQQPRGLYNSRLD
jgi:hypothetical protein